MLFIVSVDARLKLDQLSKLMREMNSESDRAAAIVGGSLVEMGLTTALKDFLHPDEYIVKELFRSSGALGAFATKIRVGFLIGLYGPAAYRDLVRVKDIRNRFAHSLEVSDFTDDKVRDWANNLTLCDRYVLDLSGMLGDDKMPDANPEKASRIGDWRWWFGIPNLAEQLKTPRGRFLVTAQALTYALSGTNSRAPEPPF